MTTVARLLDAKGHDAWTIDSRASVYEAIEMMADRNVGALLVVSGDTLAGIVSERDYARKVILQGKSSRDTEVRDIMSSSVVSVRPDQSVEDCMALMTEKRVRHLPVLDNGRIGGMISIGDVVRSLLSDKDHTISQLEGYITGSR